MKTYQLQPADHVDQVLEDGTELIRRPYPFFVTDLGTVIGERLLPDGSGLTTVTHVVGFQQRLHRQTIDVTWQDVAADPSRVVGSYLVICDEGGHWHTIVQAIASVDEVTNYLAW